MDTEKATSEDEITFLSDADALEEGLRLGCVGVWRWKIDSDLLQWTRNLESVHHLPPGSFDGSLSSFQRDLHPSDAGEVWQKIKASIEHETPYRAVYRTSPRPNQAELWIETAGAVTTAPDGSRYLTGICLDVTDRVKKERQLVRRLSQQHAVAQFGAYALNEDSLQNVLDEAVRVAADVLHVPLTKILKFSDSADHLVLCAGIGWNDGLVGHGAVDIDRASQAGFTLMTSGPVLVSDILTETRFSGPQLLHDHEVRSGISVVIPGAGSRPFGVFGIHARDVREFDTTDAEFLQSIAHIVAGAVRHAAASDHKTLLVREMAHRAGNMLQLVNSIAGKTFSPDADPQLARRSFSERLNALARSNYVVARGGWTATPFRELVEETLQPFGSRVIAEGRNVLLPPEFCFDMGLILHELATNSAKYGTLGQQDGSVLVRWTFRPRSQGARLFSFEWEDPMPMSATSATGTGFGSKLMSALIERKWNGTVTVSEDSNFRLTIEVSLAE
ncbi:MAG: GAF domain-containing protein [Hoeflea sp.]|uniref:sensor histidine kinase n=1 Tax=Hoeflea sp. TaxID=1940281 RepID=UPI001DB7F670|nr:HWE histidine kinase domain-containing protein [Hoeflea sp.]MBU4530313.1 GAF domain-containing protein [Alphaproteobacteria bacterium]MBU4545100.1 GAF domain-containing protein [Alphaproteobacteria bacterium]MBU4549700.1 GAF domain-containing protein [Alphaproteobacteria bacterium]MBV1721903.1 GAF domain-containing protein [Hoeflea sp.]MBV1761253.1 GAF domain-containing protein [Hoeflea sp.]